MARIKLKPGEYISRECVPLSPSGRRKYGAAMLMVTVVRKMGPAAADTPEVAVEKRAAEIVAGAELEDCERCGAFGHDDDLPMHSMHTASDYNAGYLARVIATHDGESP